MEARKDDRGRGAVIKNIIIILIIVCVGIIIMCASLFW